MSGAEKRPRPFVLVWLDWIYSAAGPRSEIREVLSTMATRIDDDGTRAFQSHATLGRRLGKHARTISRRCKRAVALGWLREVSGGDGTVIVYRATLPPHVQQLIESGHTPDKLVSGVTPDKLLSGVDGAPPLTSSCHPTPDKLVSGTPDKLVSDDRLLTVSITGGEAAAAPAIEQIDERTLTSTLRALGVVIAKRSTHPQRWIAEGITLDRLTEAVQFIRLYRKPRPQPIFAAYLDEIVHDPEAICWRPDPEHVPEHARELIAESARDSGADTMQRVIATTTPTPAIAVATRRSLRVAIGPMLPEQRTLTLDEIDHRVRVMRDFDAATIAKSLAQYGVTIEQVRESQARIGDGAAHA